MWKIYFILIGIILIITKANSQTKVILKSNICAFNKQLDTPEIYTWDANNQALEYVKKICDVAFIVPNFVVRRANVDNAIATSDDNNNRVIYYSQAFFQTLNNETFKIAILAHEIGHFVNNHTFSKNDRRPSDELEADQFAGSILCKLGYHIEDIKELLNVQCSTQGDGYYPPRSARIEAFTYGFERARCNENTPIFEKTFNPSDFRLSINQINHFTYKQFTINNLDINKDFILKFQVKSYRTGGSTRYGIAWNFESGNEYLLFTIHTINSGYYSIGPGNNSNYVSFSRFDEGAISLNGENGPDELQIKKVGEDLIFVINNKQVWRTSNYKLTTNKFAFWLADTTEAALLTSSASQ